MKDDAILTAIEKAKSIAEQYSEYKNEIFTAVLTKELLNSQNATPPISVPTTLSIKSLSVRELLNDKKPKNDVQSTLIFGYYLEVVKGKSGFTSQEISDCYNEAKEQAPTNISDKIQMNIRNGCMMQTDNKVGKNLVYTLTNTGLSVMEKGFKKES